MLRVDAASQVTVGIVPPSRLCSKKAPEPILVLAAVAVMVPPVLISLPLMVLLATVRLAKFSVLPLPTERSPVMDVISERFANVSVRALEPPKLKLEPASMPSAVVPLADPRVRVVVAEAWKVTEVLLLTAIRPMVWVLSPVAVELPPPVNKRISEGSAANLCGDQLAGSAKSAVPDTACQV